MSNNTIDTSSKQLWESAKAIYLSSLSARPEEKSQAERYLGMITSVSSEGDSFRIYTSTEFAADLIRRDHLNKLKGSFLLAGASENINIEVSYDASAKPTLIVPSVIGAIGEKLTSSAPSAFVSTMPLNDDYTFEKFVSGPSNSFAIAAAKAVVKNPGRQGCSPLFIHGGTGLGKTHLMQAIGNELKRRDPSLAICYLTAEEYLNEYVNYMKDNNIPKFREKYRKLDVLLLDDVQFFQKGKEIQEEFFNTFNALKDKKKQIVMTSDVAPKNLPPSIEARLISRFEGGMLQEIESPNYETRLAILKKKAEDSEVKVPDFALEYISDNIKSHVRAMEGALATVEVYISANPSVIINKLILTDLLDDFIKKEQSLRKLTIEEIQQTCAKKFAVTMKDILSHERIQSIVTPRQLAMYIARKYTSKGLKEIAKAFDKQHATIISGVKTIQERLSTEPGLKADLEEILSSLGYKLSDSME